MSQENDKSKKNNPHFPTAKIKKIIQENQEIGKLSNLIPPLMEKSLQIFLEELLEKVDATADQYQISKLTPSVLKNALEQLQKYHFLKDTLEDVDDLTMNLDKKRSTKSVDKLSVKRSTSSSEIKEEKQKPKRGRKKVKVDSIQEQSL